MARHREGSSKKSKHGTRAKPMLHKAMRTIPSKLRKARKKARQHYIANRAKILKKARQRYRKNRAKILRKAKLYRKKKKSGRAPYYKHGVVGGRYPRYKRLRRLNKYTRVGGKHSGRRK